MKKIVEFKVEKEKKESEISARIFFSTLKSSIEDHIHTHPNMNKIKYVGPSLKTKKVMQDF